MNQYDVVVILWEDHHAFYGSPLPENPDELVETPLMNIGLLYKETDKVVVLVSEIVPGEVDESNFIVIHKTAIVGMKKYGQIEVREFNR